MENHAFEKLLDDYIVYVSSGRTLYGSNTKVQASSMHEKNRIMLWNYVNAYVRGLATKHFRGRDVHEYRSRNHEERVMAFYDFIDYAVKRGKGVRWILKVFKLRFSRIEATLRVKRLRGVNVDDVVASGFDNSFARRGMELEQARRLCIKEQRREWHQNLHFDDLKPCLQSRGMQPQNEATWRRYHDHRTYLWQVSNPLPLKDFARSLDGE